MTESDARPPALDRVGEQLPDPVSAERTASFLADFIRNETLPDPAWLARIIECGPPPNAAAAMDLFLNEGGAEVSEYLLAFADRIIADWPGVCADYGAFIEDQVLPDAVPPAHVVLRTLRESGDHRYWPAVTAFAHGSEAECEEACLALEQDPSERAEELVRTLIAITDLTQPYETLVRIHHDRDDRGWARVAADLANEEGWSAAEQDAFLNEAADALALYEAHWGELLDEDTVLDVAEDGSLSQQVREVALANAIYYLVDDEEEAAARDQAKQMMGRLQGMLDNLSAMSGQNLGPGTGAGAERDQDAIKQRINALSETGLVARGDIEAPQWYAGVVLPLED